jgi:hypothetical protein
MSKRFYTVPHNKASADPIGQLYLDLAARIIADPKVRALRRASAANALRDASRPLLALPPPPPRRWRCQRLHHHGRITVEGSDHA